MKAEIHTEVKVVLTLSQEEAEWLQAVTQNPLAEDETMICREMRANIFTTLKDILNQRHLWR